MIRKIGKKKEEREKNNKEQKKNIGKKNNYKWKEKVKLINTRRQWEEDKRKIKVWKYILTKYKKKRSVNKFINEI